MFEINIIPNFEKDVKYYKNKKNYRQIEEDINSAVQKIAQGHLVGKKIPGLSLKESVYKVRVKNSSANVGKSNGFRIVYYVVEEEQEVYLITIYSKKDKADIPPKEIAFLVGRYFD